MRVDTSRPEGYFLQFTTSKNSCNGHLNTLHNQKGTPSRDFRLFFMVSKPAKGGIFGHKPKFVFKGSTTRLGKNKPKPLNDEAVYLWDGGHETTTQDVHTSADGRRFATSSSILEVAKPTASRSLEPQDAPMDSFGPLDNSQGEVHVVVREPKPAKRYFVSVSVVFRKSG